MCVCVCAGVFDTKIDVRTEKSDDAALKVMSWRTIDLRSPTDSDVPSRLVNFFCLATERVCVCVRACVCACVRAGVRVCVRAAHCSIARSASPLGAQVAFCRRRQRSERDARMLQTSVRRSGWSGWFVLIELASPSAESAVWAAEIVALTWSESTPVLFDSIISVECIGRPSRARSDRTDMAVDLFAFSNKWGYDQGYV